MRVYLSSAQVRRHWEPCRCSSPPQGRSVELRFQPRSSPQQTHALLNIHLRPLGEVKLRSAAWCLNHFLSIFSTADTVNWQLCVERAHRGQDSDGRRLKVTHWTSGGFIELPVDWFTFFGTIFKFWIVARMLIGINCVFNSIESPANNRKQNKTKALGDRCCPVFSLRHVTL